MTRGSLSEHDRVVENYVLSTHRCSREVVPLLMMTVWSELAETNDWRNEALIEISCRFMLGWLRDIAG